MPWPRGPGGRGRVGIDFADFAVSLDPQLAAMGQLDRAIGPLDASEGFGEGIGYRLGIEAAFDAGHCAALVAQQGGEGVLAAHDRVQDRKSTRLNSSHVKISYAVFCLKKKSYLFKLYSRYIKCNFRLYFT